MSLSEDPANKSNRIKKLPPLLVNQLAAGEVVTRPASVVKELLENAIDAGASQITIRITQGGMGLIEVCDNGCGIHPDDMVMAVTRFATSKIADVAHLNGIATLGFRGEALAATAAVSRLTIKSCSDYSGIGRELTVAGILDDTPELIPIVHAQGTSVMVKDLYFNVPARRGNLKSISTEFAHIESVVKHIALSVSNVSISLWHNEKRRFNFEAINNGAVNDSPELNHVNKSFFNHSSFANQPDFACTALARLKNILPQLDTQAESVYSQLIPVNIDLDGLLTQSDAENTNSLHSFKSKQIKISGFLIPSKASSSAIIRLIYINGRLVKDRGIAQCVRESVQILLAYELDDYNDLGYVLFLQLPLAWLNVNVHPSKQTIKIQNLANITAHLQVGLRNAIQAWCKDVLKQLNQLDLSNNCKINDAVVNNNALNSNNLNKKSLAEYATASKQKSTESPANNTINSTQTNESLFTNAESTAGLHSVSNRNSVCEPSSSYDSINNQLSNPKSEAQQQANQVLRYQDNPISYPLCLEVMKKGNNNLVLLQINQGFILIDESSLLSVLSDNKASHITQALQLLGKLQKKPSTSYSLNRSYLNHNQFKQCHLNQSHINQYCELANSPKQSSTQSIKIDDKHRVQLLNTLIVNFFNHYHNYHLKNNGNAVNDILNVLSQKAMQCFSNTQLIAYLLSQHDSQSKNDLN